MDPSAFHDEDEYYLLWGGIWGGQLQWYENQKLVAGRKGPTEGIPAPAERALMSHIAKLDDSMTDLSEKP